MNILLLLILLQLKHYYADFVIQTYQQVVQKGIYRDLVGISHSLDHVWTTLIVLLIFNGFHPLAPLTIVGLAFFEGIIHYHIDFIKVKHGEKNASTALYWNHFGIDQLAHQLTYLAMVAYIFNLVGM